MNNKHAVVQEGGKTVVINEAWDADRRRNVISRSTFQSVRDFYSNQKVIVGFTDEGTPKVESLGGWWLNHPDRSQFEGVVFSPHRNSGAYYNLWRGLLWTPDKATGVYLNGTFSKIYAGPTKNSTRT